MKLLAYLLVSVCYVGRVPFAPGTAGSAVAVIYCCASAFWADSLWYKLLVMGVPCLLAFASIPLISLVEKWEKRPDPGFIVIDEFFGQLICFFFVSQSTLVLNPWLFPLGFFLFRFFDILKPLFIKRVEAIGGGTGVIADDALAGLYGGAILGVIGLILG